jgi:hypothetical protein
MGVAVGSSWMRDGGADGGGMSLMVVALVRPEIDAIHEFTPLTVPVSRNTAHTKGTTARAHRTFGAGLRASRRFPLSRATARGHRRAQSPPRHAREPGRDRRRISNRGRRHHFSLMYISRT